MVIIMLKLLNKILFYGKIVLHIIAFCFVFYIMLRMQDYYHSGFLDLILLFIPMFLITIVFVVSFFFDKGNKNAFFNVACFLSLLAIVIICARVLFDKNMILGIKDKINFYFFQNQISQIKLLYYMTFIVNCLLIYQDKVENN